MEPLVGRSAELEQVARLVDDVSRGVARVAFIEGEAGIGKSRLLQASLDAAAKAGFRVAAGAARDLERDRAFGLIVDAFGLTDRADDDFQREIARLIEGERGLSHSRFRVIERLVELVETIAIDRPLVIAAEDLHWADPSSILALDRLATSIEHLPVLLLCTARPAPRSTELTSLVGSFDAIEGARIILGPLDDAAVDELVGRTLGADVGPRLAVKVGGAAGNPLFVTELLTALDQEGLIDLRDGMAEVGDVATPPSLTLTILRRLAFLSDETLEVLRVASVLGTAFTMKDLTAVTGREAVALLSALEEASSAALIVGSADHLTFRHELVRDAIYMDMLEPVRRALHAQAARALSDAGASTSQVATHAAIGADVGDLRAIEWLRTAARAALWRSPPVAVQFLERALDLTPEDSAVQAELGLQTVRAYLSASQPIDASRLARELLGRRIPREIHNETFRCLVMALAMQGEGPEAVEEIDAALAGSITDVEVARLVATRANVLRTWDRAGARPEAERALELGRRAGDPLAEYVASQTLAFCNGFDGYLDDALEIAVRSRRMVSSLVDQFEITPDERVSPALYLVWGDRFDEAQRLIDAARSDGDDSEPAVAAVTDYNLAHLELWTGRWDEALATAEAGLDVAERSGMAIERVHLRQLMCYVAIHRDELELAASEAEKMEGACWIPALLAEAKGDTAELVEWLDVYRTAGVNNPIPWQMSLATWWGPDWVRLYLGIGDRTSALVMTEMLEEAARRSRTPTAKGAALRCRGLYEEDGDLLLKAVDAYRAGPRVFDRGQACEWAAGVLGRDPASADTAIGLLEEALTVYESVGATRAIAKAEAHLRSLGVRRGRRGPRGRPKSGWESLTPTEERVTALVGEGLTYREVGERLFISRRTVETHVAHVFVKVGLASRRELVEAASLRGAKSEVSAE